MASTGARRRTARRKPSRARRTVRKLTLKQARARWKRRYRTVKRQAQAARNTPRGAAQRVRDGVRKARSAPARAKNKASKAYRKARGKVPFAPSKRHRELKARIKAHDRRERAERKAAAQTVTRPSPLEAAKTAGPWVAVGGVMIAAPLSFGVGGGWLGVAGGACVAVSGAAYAAERKWGTTDHVDRESRRALKRHARSAGCHSACMTSSLPVRTCKCPCGGSTHGSARKGAAA